MPPIQPGPWRGGYTFPEPSPGPVGPWRSGYGFPPSMPPQRDSAQTPLGTPPPAAQPDPGTLPAQAAPGPGPPQAGPSPYAPPQGPDYDAIVNSYLERLTRPMPLPRPRPLSGLQALAVEMNPQRRGELLENFQGGPYRRDVAQFQSDRAREGQGAELAAKLGTAQETERYRRAVMENTAAYRQGQQRIAGERTDLSRRRTDAYVNRTAKGTGPKDWASELARLDKEIELAGRDVIGGQSKGAQMGLTLGPSKEGKAAQAAIAGPMQDAQSRYARLNDLRQKIQRVMSSPEFQRAPRQFQNRVIERLMTTSGPPPEDQQPGGYPPADLGDEDLADAD